MSASRTTWSFFAVSAPGLEALLERELVSLGVQAKAVVGGVEGRVSHEGLWRLHLESRLAESIRIRCKPFMAKSFEELQRGLSRLPFHAFLRAGEPSEVSVSCHESRLYHSDAVRERVSTALRLRLVRSAGGADCEDAAALLASVDAQKAGQHVHVRILRDRVTVSIDASGERLHKRGYRRLVLEAPLRETLAAAAVQLLGQLGQEVQRVWDPFCGSGVLGLEWLAARTRLPPGVDRRFAFERWPVHDPVAWERVLGEARARPGASDAELSVLGSDLAERALLAARGNAEAAGFGALAKWVRGDFQQVAEHVEPGTAILTNPPYGRRLASPREANRLHHRFDQLLTRRTDLRPVVVVTDSAVLLEHSRLPWKRLARTRTGGLRVNIIGLAD